jgi:hypothetical protein
MISTASPVLAIPVSIRPVATVPRPVIEIHLQLASRKAFQYLYWLFNPRSTASINSRIFGTQTGSLFNPPKKTLE